MNLIPAPAAGGKEIVLATPPSPEGKVLPMVLLLAEHLGVKTILKAGGAQAIAAMAFGTESVGRVFKITGPGNAYVAVAKQLVSGTVGIDSIAGPSEVVILADAAANPAYIAADLIAQAEHGSDSASFLVSTSGDIIERTNAELEKQIAFQPREKFVRLSLSKSFAAKVANLDEAFDVVNRIAPEHLEAVLSIPDEEVLDRARNAAAIFFGSDTPVAAGDYYAGTNHVLPTNGTAAFSSPLGVYDFMKRTSFVRMNEETIRSAAEPISAMARYEGLEAHARSAEIRK
jgi:histidinol dehydrogenase